MKKKIISLTFLIFLIIIIITIHNYAEKKRKDDEVIQQKKIQRQLDKQERIKSDILSHYNKYVITNDVVNIYSLVGDQFIASGSIGKNQKLELKDLNITYMDEYFPIETFSDYYVYYKDVNKVDEIEKFDERYKKYIIFNENIVTYDNTNFYDINDNLIYNFNNSFDLPIIAKLENKYGVEINNKLLYINKDDVKEIRKNNNTSLKNTESIAVLNYHFFFDEDFESERKDCSQSICMSKQRFKTHLDFIKNNDIFTPTLNEFEMYLDGKIQLPKSVVITIDDGWRTDQGIDLLEEYELNATVFLITSWFDEIIFLDNYKFIEYHSHGDNLHNQGDCPGGQGGAIKCKNREYLLNDLKVSSEKLNGSKYFCYPFYEYNDYSISILKEAGYRMAFAGGGSRAYIGVDKYQIPRFAIQYYETSDDIASHIES